MSLIPGINYAITANMVGPLAISNNQVSPAILFSYPWASAPNVVIEYSIVRGAINEAGRIYVSTNGTVVSVANDKANTSDTGVTFSFAISGSNIEAQYTSTNIGTSAQLWYNKLVLN